MNLKNAFIGTIFVPDIKLDCILGDPLQSRQFCVKYLYITRFNFVHNYKVTSPILYVC